MKRQTMTRLATPSIAESIPKPIRAIEPASDPGDDRDRALGAHPREASQESRRAAPGGASHSRLRADRAAGGRGARGRARSRTPLGHERDASSAGLGGQRVDDHLPLARDVDEARPGATPADGARRGSTARSTIQARSQTQSSSAAQRRGQHQTGRIASACANA